MNFGDPVIDRLIFVERTEVDNPPDGFYYVYLNANGRLVVRDSSGGEFIPGSGGGGGGGSAAFPTIASMISTNVSNLSSGDIVYVAGYSEPGDGGEGYFEYNSGSSANEVQGFIIAPNSGGGRFLRLHGSEISVLWGGINPGSDSGTEIQNVIDYAGSLSGVHDVIFYGVKGVSGNVYRTSQTITCPHENVNILFENDAGDLEYTSTDGGNIWEIGSPNYNLRGRKYKIHAYRASKVASWSGFDEVGILFINVENSEIYLRSLDSNVNVEFRADNDGSSYNNVTIEELRSGRIQLLLNDVNGGWVNQNTFYGGRFWNTSGDDSRGERFGIWIRSIDGQYANNNNNLFFHNNLEIRGTGKGATDESVGIVLDGNARDNYFIRPRCEGCDYVWEFPGTAFRNYVDIGYDSSTAVERGFGGGGGNIVMGGTNRNTNTRAWNYYGQKVFGIEDVPGRANYWQGGEVYLDTCSWGSSSSDIVTDFMDQVSLTEDYLQISSTRTVGFFVSTRQVKNFFLTRETEDGYEGRVAVRAYDSSGSVMADPNAIRGNNFTWRSGFGGGMFRTDSDMNQGQIIEVNDNVDRIWIGFNGGSSNDMRLKSFALYTKDAICPRVWPGYSSEWTYGEGKRVGAQPVAGIWKLGEIAWNGYPSAGEPVGWMCTSAGEFGTATEPQFASMGLLEASV